MEKMDAERKQDAEPLPKEEGSQKKIGEEAEFFPPLRFSEKKGEVLVEKGIEESEIDVEQGLQKLLRGISEETLRLREFLMEENRLVNELCVSIKQIMKKINVSFDIPPQKIPVEKKVERVILNEEGYLMLFSGKGEVSSAFLAEYPPGVVMAVLWVVMPKLTEVVVGYRKKVSKRVGFFRRLKKELKDIAKTVVGGKGETVESAVKDAGVREK